MIAISFHLLNLDCNILLPSGLPSTVQKAASHIARKAVELDIVPGKSPISVAAAAIYMASQASNDKRTQKEIGDIAGVADVTIRQSYKLMYPRTADLFPNDFKFVTSIEQLPQAWNLPVPFTQDISPFIFYTDFHVD